MISKPVWGPLAYNACIKTLRVPYGKATFVRPVNSPRTARTKPVSVMWLGHYSVVPQRQGKRTAVGIAIVTSSMTFFSLYITLMTCDTRLYFTVINQSEARLSTEHGIHLYTLWSCKWVSRYGEESNMRMSFNVRDTMVPYVETSQEIQMARLEWSPGPKCVHALMSGDGTQQACGFRVSIALQYRIPAKL